MQFSVCEHPKISETGQLVHYNFIVLKNSFHVVVYFTKLEQYASKFDGKYHGWNKKSMQNSKTDLQYICKALNYLLIDHASKNNIICVSQVTPHMVAEFFETYSSGEKLHGGNRSQQSIFKCTDAISHFFANASLACGVMAKMQPDDLLKTEQIRTSRKNGRTRTVYIPLSYPKAEKQAVSTIFRDIPTEALDRLISLSQVHTPEITFALICQITAGLRPSEALNLRQDTSSLGPSIRMSFAESRVHDVEIDLRSELVLRSDCVRVGGIKKRRVQKVYPSFINIFMDGKAFHEHHLVGKNCEKEYSPMFFSRNGKAMTYASYLKKFHKLVYEYLRPAMLSSEKAELQIFGQRLQTEKLSPHSLRHSFTVNLVLLGADIATLQFYRGDSSPESAPWYLQNKGELDRLAKTAHEDALQSLLNIPHLK